MKYNRSDAIDYAEKYAMSKNPAYYFFGGIGGDCTNFVSQCLHAGGFEMIYNYLNGWFYTSAFSRSPSWSGVEYFRNFLLNPAFAPIGKSITREEIIPGDVVFLSDGKIFYHSLFVSRVENDEIYVCAHSDASLNRKLSTYSFKECQFIGIED